MENDGRKDCSGSVERIICDTPGDREIKKQDERQLWGNKIILCGSYTVEAALLMGVLIPLLVGVIYLGFFMMIRGNVQGEAIEKALTALLIGEETEGVSLGEKEVSVEAEAAVPAFPFGKRVFSLADSVQGRFVLERQKPSETIFRMHSLKKAIRQVKKE